MANTNNDFNLLNIQESTGGRNDNYHTTNNRC
jgi:hypothetical protein